MITAQDTKVMRISRDNQHTLVVQAREVIRFAPLVRPRTPSGNPMRVRVTSAGDVGWVGDGGYRYSATQRDGNPWPSIPDLWKRIATAAYRTWARANDADPDRAVWDTALLNWYDPDASLGWHVDQTEADRTLPIVTISLGDPCSWAVRADGDAMVSRCRLESGDITVLAGETRNYLHTVERILSPASADMFAASPLPTRGRLSITIRCGGEW